MEVLETFRLEQNRQDKVAELQLLKASLERQLVEARNEQSELRKNIDELVESGGIKGTRQRELQESLASNTWLGVSIKSFEDNLQIQFNPAFPGQLPPEHYVLEVEMEKNRWDVIQHSLPPFIPVDKLGQASKGDLKTFIASLSDYLYAYVQRREAVQLIKKRFSGYLSGDIEADLPVAYIHLQLLLQLSHGATKIVEITLQYDMTKTRPDQVEIEAEVPDKQSESWKQWLLTLELDEGLEQIIEDCG